MFSSLPYHLILVRSVNSKCNSITIVYYSKSGGSQIDTIANVMSLPLFTIANPTIANLTLITFDLVM